MMKYIIKFFLRGLIVLAPLAITSYCLIWFFVSVESVARHSLETTLNFGFYFPGLGILCAVAMIVGIGIVMSSLVAQRLHGVLQAIIARLPILKTIYFAIDDFMDFFAGSQKADKANKVVIVHLHEGMDLVGIMTNSNVESLVHTSLDHKVAVYLPMSYQIGGYTIFIERSRLTETDLSVEAAMKLAMTGWIRKSEGKPTAKI